MCIHNCTDSLCSLRVMPRTDNIGITFGCNGQCTITTQFQDNQCVNRFKELGIHCNQTECSPRNFDLSACITAENETTTANTTNQNCDCQCSTRSNRDAVTSDMPMGQSQTCIPPTIIYRTEITNKTEFTTCISSTNQPSTAVAALAIMVGILIVLLVIVLIALMWTCWTFKIKGTTKSQYQQHR